MSTATFLASFTVAYILAMIALSWWAGKKFVGNEGEFMLGGRQFNSFLSTIGNSSILISGGFVPAIVLFGYLYGVGGAWYYVGWGVGMLVTMLLWAGFWRSSGAYTPTEWFEYRYGRGGRLAISFIILVAILAIIGWQFLGSGATMAGALGISTTQSIVFIGIAVIIYVMLGGVWSATLTDLVQFSWVVLTVFVAIPVYLFLTYGAPDAAALPEGFTSLPFGSVPILQLTLPSVMTFVILNLSLTNQAPYWTRAASALNRRTVMIAWGLSFLIAIATGISGSLIGIYARTLAPNLEDPSLALGSVLDLLPVWLAALALAGLLAATMSTVDIYLVSGVNQLIRDVAQYLLGMSDSQQLLRWAKWATVIYGALAVLFAATWTSGLAVLFGFGTAIGAPLFVFFLDSWLLKIGNGPGAIASAVASLLTVLIWDRLTNLSESVHALWIVFPVSFIVLVVVSLIFRGRTGVSEESSWTGELSSFQKKAIGSVAKGYSSAADIVDYCNARELGMQLPAILGEMDQLVEQGYLRRRGERMTSQLYFDLTPEGRDVLSDVIGSKENESLQTYGLGLDAKTILDAARQDPGITSLALAQAAGISLEAVGPVINHLESKRLVRIHGLITPRVSPTQNADAAVTESVKV